PATRDLCVHMLRDSARIQEGDAAYLNKKLADEPGFKPVVPLYTEEDAIRALDRFVSVPYGMPFSPLDGVSARFLDAGHILGSAGVAVDLPTPAGVRRFVASGDIGRKGLPILRDPVVPDGASWAIMESTYGGKAHGDIHSMHEDLERV